MGAQLLLIFSTLQNKGTKTGTNNAPSQLLGTKLLVIDLMLFVSDCKLSHVKLQSQQYSTFVL